MSSINHQRIGTETGGLENKRTSRNHPNYSIIKIGQNTERSPEDLRRLDVTQSLHASVKNFQKTLKIVIIIIIITIALIPVSMVLRSIEMMYELD